MHHIFYYSEGEDSDSENECRYLEQEESDEATFYDDIIREDENDNATFQSFQDQCVILNGVRCAAHTLQLVVLKAIGSDKYCNIISLARQVAKKIEDPKYGSYVTTIEFKKAYIGLSN